MPLSAQQAAKTTSLNTKPKMTLEEYLENRINDSATRGFSSSKIWIRSEYLKEAEKLLTKAGFKVNKLEESESGSEKWEVSW